MDCKVLVLDIDGTLNNSQKIVTERTKNSIIDAQTHGVTIVIASGRPHIGIVPVAEQIGLDKTGGYILSYNGGQITECKSNQVIYKKMISKEFIPEVYSLSKKLNVNLMTYSDGKVIAEYSDEFLELECRINKTNCVKVKSFIDEVTYDVPKFIMLGEGDYLASIEDDVKSQLGSRFSVTRSEPFFLEIMPQFVDKAYSLGVLLQHLGYSKENMIACGDGFNDISMIKLAGIGVAMANAQQAVKDVCDFVTLSNDNDGIAHVIERFILKQYIA